jgi:MGT family glycosyltransferase
MSRILAYTSPERGQLFPITPTLLRLRDHGHDVTLRTLASQAPLMRSLGIDAAPVDAKIEAVAPEDWRGRNPREALAISVRAFAARAKYDAADLEAAIAAEHPDALLVDVNSWGALAAAEKWGGPWAMFCPYPIALRAKDVPPFGPGFAPAHGPATRIRDALLRPVVLGAIGKAMLPELNRLRRSMGLPLLQRADDIYAKPPLVLYLTAEPFEYPRANWPGNIVMVGPCAWEPAQQPPEWLAAVEGPIVLVTTSSQFQNDGRLVAAALEALADEPVTVVATVPAGTPDDYTVPANAHLEKFVPHGPVLERAVCAITHGGMGATQKALALGVPVCAVPFGRDQFEVARRVEVAGAGTFLPSKQLNADRLRAKVREAMTKTEGARRVAAGSAAAGGADAAVDAIEKRLLGDTPRKKQERAATI